MIALDAIDIYNPPDNVIICAFPLETATPLPTLQPAADVELIRGAPTVQPTPTDPAPTVIDVAIVIAYDENANRSVDPAEGVRGIPVRLVEVGTNRVITKATTDAAGYAALEAIANAELRLVVPYFGAYWDVRRAGQTFTLLLPAGNQPGLIP